MKLPKPLAVVGVKFTTIFKRDFWTPKHRYTALLILLVLVLAPLFTFYLQYRANICDFNAAWHFIIDRPGIFIFSSLIMLLLATILCCVCGNIALGEAILLALIVGITYAHINKVIWRASPLLPEDFLMLSYTEELGHMVGFWDLAAVILTIILIIILSIILSRWLKKRFKVKFDKKPTRIWRAIGLIISIVLLVLLTGPIRNLKGDERDFVPFLDSNLVAWNQTKNYQQNGFLIGFIYNLQIRRMDKPANYSQATIKNIVAKYQQIAKAQDAGRIDLKSQDVNIIYIQNESFIDPSRLNAVYPHAGGDVTPQLHALMARPNVSTGWQYSSDYGGGTANIEFEALTGFSNYFIGMVPYTQIISKEPNFPSFASYLDSQNYATTGMHPYVGSMYKRDIVYKNLGFNQFIDESGWQYQQKEGDSQYISDTSTYKQLMDQLSSAQKSQFITLITMQNHMPYGDVYKQHNFVSTANVSESDNKQISDYLQSLHSSDVALGNLIAQLDKSNKKVILAFWGDHLPGIYNNLPADDHAKYETPLFIYSNFSQPKQPLGTISANYIAPAVLDSLNAKKSGFFYLLADAKKSEPILTKTYHRTGPAVNTQALKDYQLIEYDIVSGKKYAEKLGLFN